MQRLIALLVTATLLASPALQAKPHSGKAHKGKNVIVVKPGYHHKPYRNHYSYHRHELARVATFAVFAGVTYAIVENAYYRQQGDSYVYVAQPPAGSYQVVSAEPEPVPATPAYALGQVIQRLPAGSQVVTVDGVSYREHNGVWFAPLQGGKRYVVTASPLN
ncbi:hypothetical protein SAMN04488540_11781 [Ferrimonas sediminum]|uniref:Uncharacterized protein n=1 Tax=Ferrimonas sediminum TaxID=718193 RepID=A0A1G8YHT4_9GAMM|nr:hypothetical protein [Ferrimonas sediminum]SDK02378.1 hypothetical protein SAMN04488540_11781 [Ferrimonas sediminum]